MLLWRGTHVTRRPGSLGVLGGALVAGGLRSRPAQLGPVYRGVDGRSRMALSKVTTPIFMGIDLLSGDHARRASWSALFGHRPLVPRPRTTTTLLGEPPAGARRGDMDHQF